MLDHTSKIMKNGVAKVKAAVGVDADGEIEADSHSMERMRDDDTSQYWQDK